MNPDLTPRERNAFDRSCEHHKARVLEKKRALERATTQKDQQAASEELKQAEEYLQAAVDNPQRFQGLDDPTVP